MGAGPGWIALRIKPPVRGIRGGAKCVLGGLASTPSGRNRRGGYGFHQARTIHRGSFSRGGRGSIRHGLLGPRTPSVHRTRGGNLRSRNDVYGHRYVGGNDRAFSLVGRRLDLLFRGKLFRNRPGGLPRERYARVRFLRLGRWCLRIRIRVPGIWTLLSRRRGWKLHGSSSPTLTSSIGKERTRRPG